MKRKLTVLFVVVAGLAIAAVAATMLLVRPERLKEEALARVRAASGYAVEAGDASLKLGWRGVGVRVDDVRLASPDSSQVMSVDEIDLYAKIFPLLKKRVDLTRVVLTRPVYVYDAVRAATPESRSSAPAAGAVLAVESWSVNDGTFRQRADWGSLELGGLDLAGTFRWGAAEGGTGSAAGTSSGGTMQGTLGSFPIPSLDAKASFHVPAALDSVVLPEVAVRTGDLAVSLSGAYTRGRSGYFGSLAGAIEPVSWDAVKGFVPPEMLHGAELAGTFALPELRLIRNQAGESWAEGTLDFRDVAAKLPGAPLGLSGFTGSARFTRESVTVGGASGKIGEDPLTVSATVAGGTAKTARITVATRLSGGTLGRLVPPSAPLRLAGGALVINLAMETPVPPPPKSLPTSMQGTVTLDDLSGTYRDLPVSGLRGALRFAGHGAALDGIGGSCGNSDVSVSGTLADLSRPDLRFHLVSRVLDLDQLMPEKATAAAGDPPAASPPSGPAVGVPGTGTVAIGILRLRGVEVRDVKADATLSEAGLALDHVTGKVGDGTVSGNVALEPLGGPDAWRYTGGLTMTSVPVDPLLGRWRNVASLLDGAMSGSVSWDGRAQKGIDPRRGLSLNGDVTLKEGALTNIPALATLAQTFKVAGGTADRWPFQSLGLRFHVKDGNLIVEGLQMTQAGMAWKLGGSVGIDGALALTGSVRADPDRISLPSSFSFLAPFLAEKDGKVPLDFRLGGSVASPAVTVDWDAMAQRAGDRLKEEEQKKLQEKIAPGKQEAIDKLKNLLGGKKGG
jgi:AsmA-like C-terminal region